MNVRYLLAAYRDWRKTSTRLVLASVFETAGSTYSKTGARMLITDDGRFQGMLSGGCLEGDLAERAAAVCDSGVPETVTYDLGQDDDALWGLGVGCDGLMRIFLQPLDADGDYQPFAALADIYDGDEAGVAVTVLESRHGALSSGATLVLAGNRPRAFGIGAPFAAILSERAGEALKKRRSFREQVVLDGQRVDCLFAVLRPPPRVLVLGGGLDAEPVVRLIAELGWRAVVQDHRPAYIDKGDFRAAESVLNLAVDALDVAIDLERFDAVIVMSHHLDTDRRYLEWLSDSRVPYIGLLGPIDRKHRLLSDLGARARRLEGRLHGPAGLDVGGRGPASIALSIVAEIHRALLKYGETPPN